MDNLKVIVKEKKLKQNILTDKDARPGYVFQYKNGPIALKLDYNQIMFLTYSSGRNWLELARDKSFQNDSVKILGKLTEIVVDPNV